MTLIIFYELYPQLYDTLVEAHPSLHVFKKEDFPERFHYANHPRILPLLGYVDANWNLATVSIKVMEERKQGSGIATAAVIPGAKYNKTKQNNTGCSRKKVRCSRLSVF